MSIGFRFADTVRRTRSATSRGLVLDAALMVTAAILWWLALPPRGVVGAFPAGGRGIHAGPGRSSAA
uniref:Uncharacterized protein n=1 Tax=Janibacter limosus TaxID=53458 RepID=A0AC61U1J2_9MICO|nr:hypothetical protein [Janibacter limosus]